MPLSTIETALKPLRGCILPRCMIEVFQEGSQMNAGMHWHPSNSCTRLFVVEIPEINFFDLKVEVR